MKLINPYKMFQGAFIPNALMECRELSQSAKLLWARLAQYAGQDGRCFPAIETLGEDIGLSRSMAKKVVKELVDFRLIMVRHANGKDRLMHKTSEYFFLDHEIFHDHKIVTSGGSKNGPSGRTVNGPSKEGPKMDRPIEENQLRESGLSSSSSGQENCPDGGEEKPKKYHGTVEDYELAQRIYKAVLIVNQTIKEPNWPRWANSIRLMREQDGRTHESIWHVFDWANRDPFWSNNILCPDKLREKYPQLAPKAGVVRRLRLDSKPGRAVADERTCGECVWLGSGKWFCKAGADEHERCVAGCDSYRTKESA